MSASDGEDEGGSGAEDDAYTDAYTDAAYTDVSGTDGDRDDHGAAADDGKTTEKDDSDDTKTQGKDMGKGKGKREDETFNAGSVNSCAVCGTCETSDRKLSRCTRCEAVFYCSRACQVRVFSVSSDAVAVAAVAACRRRPTFNHELLLRRATAGHGLETWSAR